MSEVPYYYNYVNATNSAVTPTTVHVRGTGLQSYFAKYLLEEVISLFDWTLPETWPKNYFLYTLYCGGFVGVINTNKFGIIPQICTLYGYNVFYQPTNIIIGNPLIKGGGIVNPKIGKDCEIIKLQPNYSGVMDIVNYYADMLALCSEGMSVNLLNSRLSYVFNAPSKNLAETQKKLFDRIASGEPATFVGKELFDSDGRPLVQLLTQNVGQNFITPQIVEVMRNIHDRFCTEIGIPNANTGKKERMLSDEVNANNFETDCKALLWFDTITEDLKKVRKMFGFSENQLNVKRKEVNNNAGNDVNKRVTDDESRAF